MDTGRSVMYLIGAVLVVAGLGYAALLMGVPPMWIGIAALVLIGFAIAGAATNRPVSSGPTEVHHHHPTH